GLAADVRVAERAVADDVPEEDPVLLVERDVQVEERGDALDVLRGRVPARRELRRIRRDDEEDQIGDDRRREEQEERPEEAADEECGHVSGRWSGGVSTPEGRGAPLRRARYCPSVASRPPVR